MVKIYRPSDRIVVKIGDVTFKLAPLTLHQKTEVQAAMIEGKGKLNIRDLTRGIALALKYSLKSVQGIVDSDGNQYQLSQENGILTDECIDDLMNMEISNQLAMIASNMATGVPKVFTDDKGQPLKGVELIEEKKEESEKKS
jgi:hypothetical protein